MRPFFAPLLALTLISFCAQAETHVPAGPVSGLWNLAGSPYLIEGTILVESTASLTIEPGVQVIMNPYCRFRIEGQLQAVGTQADSIRFLAADTAIGSEGLHFYNTNLSPQDSSRLDYCVVSYGVASPPPDPYMHGGGLYIKNSSRLRINHCFIHHCRTVDVVGANGTTGFPGTPGQSVESGRGGAIYCEHSNTVITWNRISQCRTGAAHGGNGGNGEDHITPWLWGAGGGNGGNGGAGISGEGGAFYAVNSQLTLVANVFCNNATGSVTGGTGGHGGNAEAQEFAQGGAGGNGGIGQVGSGGALYVNRISISTARNLLFENSTGNGIGGNGGYGGQGSAYMGFSGAPGQGGNGMGGNASVLYVENGNITAEYFTITSNLLIGQGMGGTGYPPGQGINGQYVIAGSSSTLTNSILWNNITPILSPSASVSYSCIQGGFPGQGNISSDPLFVVGPNGAYYLSQIAAGQTQNSPCLDAGNPASPMIIGTTRTDQIQDAGIVDMGYHYPIIASAPNLDVTLTPLNPPIQIPLQGGSFSFNISVIRNIGPQAPYTVWARIKNPDGSYTNPTLGPVNINTPVGVTITRQRTQTVPGTWVAGLYTYLGYANISYSYPAIDSSSFTFTKSTAGDGGATTWETSCTGEPFPGEVAISSQPTAFGLLSASPNPFNPTTAISFELRAASYTSLKVYDTAGRLVATLVDGWREVGTHEVAFDGSKLASGVYLVKMQTGEFTGVQKLVLLK